MYKKEFKILDRRIKWVTRDLDDKDPNQLDTIRYLVDREESRLFEKWKDKVKKHLPSLAKRVFALRKKRYEGCGFHYELEARLGQTIMDLNKVPYYSNQQERIGIRVAIKVNTHFLFKEIKKAELSSKNF